jgi:hypothetical protein
MARNASLSSPREWIALEKHAADTHARWLRDLLPETAARIEAFPDASTNVRLRCRVMRKAAKATR